MSENGQEKRETLADTVAAMHNDAELYHDAWLNDPNESPESDAVSNVLANYARRIEAAWKREREAVGNAAAMREALNDIVGIAKIALNVNCVGNSNDSELWDIIDKCKSALSAPARQCDVGTPEEQGERCLAQFDQWRRKGDGKKLITAIMNWAQTPYEAQEGGAE